MASTAREARSSNLRTFAAARDVKSFPLLCFASQVQTRSSACFASLPALRMMQTSFKQVWDIITDSTASSQQPLISQHDISIQVPKPHFLACWSEDASRFRTQSQAFSDSDTFFLPCAPRLVLTLLCLKLN